MVAGYSTIVVAVKIIPLVIEGTDHKVRQHYKYTLKSSAGTVGYFGVSFLFELSGLSIQHVKTSESVYHLVVEVLGVLGGLFSAFGIMNMVVDRILGQ